MPTIYIPILQSRLEGEAEKDAMQKSDAAQEAFLAELAKDQKRLGSKEVENLKQARGKTKDKRKAKDQKKVKDVKVSEGFFMNLPAKSLVMLFSSYCGSPEIIGATF